MSALHAEGDVVIARDYRKSCARWEEAIVREVVKSDLTSRPWYEYKVSFRTKDGGWRKSIRWAEVHR